MSSRAAFSASSCQVRAISKRCFAVQRSATAALSELHSAACWRYSAEVLTHKLLREVSRLKSFPQRTDETLRHAQRDISNFNRTHW